MTGEARHHVVVDGTDVQFDCLEGDTLLRAALRAGIGLSYECNSGSCGSCRYELLDGEVRTRWSEAPGLSARDRRKGRRLACQSVPVSDCTVRVGTPTEIAMHRPGKQRAELKEVHPLTHDLSEFVFSTGQPAVFSPGQYAMIHLPAGPVERAYSMSNVGNCYGEWRFVVKRSPGGHATSILFDKLEVGDVVELDGPYGHAYLREHDNRNIVCVGGGSGLGAMISIVLGAARLPDAGARTVHLFIGGRTTQDIVVPVALELAAVRLGELNIHAAVSDQADFDQADFEDGEVTSTPYRGFVHDAVVNYFDEAIRDFTCYAAGPPAMTDSLARALVLGQLLDADRLHFDRFY
ncbi:toluene monooxygenase electron transfer component [Haloechinothrix alba]|uniref:Toluene monooxygenase electron transfer component n=1 Tax=Haloechinothrix alba TaxID=664784 RepID=A0A238YYE1_9PSEU|nr:2Fe-2S iron-sulfur cluster binding domain-containing protein [Haloechinothrix alba]SNR75529.1 toluene monooxygenase electron transfer component [Haloechinothrix alba]